uniref:Ferric oxidoreductase domain-containing protein n=1 Tax=Cyanothece sp. (strain PCC 7425 / ATCC 29141) TaxID=395961 RepID=B8HLR8_CYAP4
MRSIKQQAFLGWSTVAIATVFIVLTSALILYPKLNDENILTALRFSSLTTAMPFLLLFVVQPLAVVRRRVRPWLQDNRRYLWLILTISHLIHLYQIYLFYQLGKSCPLTIWLATTPLWIIMIIFSAIELIAPNLLGYTYKANGATALNWFYKIGTWYIWLVFTLAFGLGVVANHLPFYNIPALVLYVAGAMIYGMVWWWKRAAG